MPDVRAQLDALGPEGTLIAYTGWQDELPDDPIADVLTAEHPYDNAYGAGTPYARLVELGGRVALLGAPLDTVTLVYHAETVAEVPGKCRMSYGMPVISDGERLWRTFSDIDTAHGALPYKRVLGGEDYTEHIARSTLAAGAGRSGLVGEAPAHLFVRGASPSTRSTGSSATSRPRTLPNREQP